MDRLMDIYTGLVKTVLFQ